MLNLFAKTLFTKGDDKKPICHFCNLKMIPIVLLEKKPLGQKWKFKCTNCTIEFSEWV